MQALADSKYRTWEWNYGSSPSFNLQRVQRYAVGEVDGIRRAIRLDFTPKAVLGDYVIVHAGFAIEVLGAEQARQNLEALREVANVLNRS